MDPTITNPPQSILGSACQALISTVQKVATDVTNFVSRCRSARPDLAPVTRELSELQMVLQLLNDYDAQQGQLIPEELQAQLRPILTNSITVVLRIDGLLRRHGNGEGEGALKWTTQGRDELTDLQKSLGMHRASMSLVSDLISILISRNGGTAVGDGRTPDGPRLLPDVLGEFQALRSAILGSYSAAALARQQYALQMRLGQIMSYAETLPGAENWEEVAKRSQGTQNIASSSTAGDMQDSLSGVTPLRKKVAENDQIIDNFVVLERGFEKVIPIAPGEAAGTQQRPASVVLTSHTSAGPSSLFSGAASTGMMIMDGAGLPGMSNMVMPLTKPATTTAAAIPENPRGRTGYHLGISESESRPSSRRTFGRRSSGDQQVSTIPEATAINAGAIIYPTEKEVAVARPEEEITEEALAFAQVPVHILGRLSLNLVGHVYTTNNSGSSGVSDGSGQTSFNQSLSTIQTEEDYYEDAASTGTSDTGSLRDGHLHFSHADVSKPPAAATVTVKPLPASQVTLVSQASVRSQATLGSQVTLGAQQPPISQHEHTASYPPTTSQQYTAASYPPATSQQYTTASYPPANSQQYPASYPPPTSQTYPASYPPPTSQPLPASYPQPTSLPLPAPYPQSTSQSYPTSYPPPISQPLPGSYPPPTSQQPLPGSYPPPTSQQQPLPASYPPPTSQPLHDSYSPTSQPPAGQQSMTEYQHERNMSSSQTSPDAQSVYGPPPPPGHRGLREMRSISTMNTQTFMQKPLPRTPLVYIPRYPGPFIKKKAVVVGNFSCGKTCLITRMSRGHYPRTKQDKCGITETLRISIDDEPIELSLWDIRGIDYDPTWLNDAHVALVCFSVNIGSTDSKGKHLGRWVAEVNRNCPGAAILLVGLKSDIRFHARSVEKLHRRGKALVSPEQGESFRENIGASRYLECSARTGDGVLEVLGETARVALQVRPHQTRRGHRRPLSRIGKFLGFGGKESAATTATTTTSSSGGVGGVGGAATVAPAATPA